MSAMDATLAGMREIVSPVVATIATTIIVFIPLYFVPAPIGQFGIEIPTIVIIMLIASLIEATTILPAHLAHSFEGIQELKSPPAAKLLSWLEGIYAKFLLVALRFRYLSTVVLLALLGGGIFVGVTFNKFVMFPIEQATTIVLSGNTPPGKSLAYTGSQVERLDKIIEKLPPGLVRAYKTEAGLSHMDNLPEANAFVAYLVLTSYADREMNATQVKNLVFKMIREEKLDEKLLNLDYLIAGGGPGNAKPLEVHVLGNDFEKKKVILDEIAADLKNMDGLSEVNSDFLTGRQEWKIYPDYKRLATAGISVSSIANTLRTAFDGMVVGYKVTDEKRIPIRVKLDEASQNYSNPLGRLAVRSNTGTLVPLRSLLSQTKGSSQQKISRYNGERINKITANIDLSKTTSIEVYERLKEKYADFDTKHPDFTLVLEGEAQESSQGFVKLVTAFVLALVGIILFLIIHFNHLTRPLLILSCIPFGMAGIFVAFAVHGFDLSLLAMTGILGYTGVVVNGSVIMIEFLSKHKDGSKDLEGMVKESRKRFRPIALTTITTVVGLFPTAYGLIGGIDLFVSPLVMAMLWGLIAGTTAVIIVTPIFYAIHDDFQRLLTRWFGFLRRKKPEASS